MHSGPAPTSPSPLPSKHPESTSPSARDVRVSKRSYAVAVCLAGVFGFVGVQHFYLGRWLEGLLDLGLTIGWFLSFFVFGEPVYGALFLVADFGHSFLVFILLLIGGCRDGEGRLVCYPGQKLPSARG